MSEISSEDRIFLKIVDIETMKVGNHYQKPEETAGER